MDPPISVPADPTPTRTITDAHFPPKPILKLSKSYVRVMHPYDAPSMIHHHSLRLTRFMSNAFESSSTIPKAYTWILTNLSMPVQTRFVLTLPPRADEIAADAVPATNAAHSTIGMIGLNMGNDLSQRTAEIGYWVAEDHQGKGIITEALPAFTDWCWTAYPDLVRIWAIAFADNVASCKAMQRAGYINEGVARWAIFKNGKSHDSVQFRMCRDEWEALQRQRSSGG